MSDHLIESEQDMDKVPGQGNYSLQYVRGGRIFSYVHQIDSVLAFEPESVLEIGVGPGMVTTSLRTMGINVTTVDIQHELHPDIEASVTRLPVSDNSVDVSLCCQVLEHLPFEQFETCLRELARVARAGVVISLPDITPHYVVHLRLPKLRLDWTGTRQGCMPKARREKTWADSGHYWEIGFPETPLKRIEKAVGACGLHIVRTWRVPDYPYHRFFSIRINRKGSHEDEHK